MPIFRFQCDACGANFPRRSSPDTASTPCECGAKAGKVLPKTIGTTVDVSVGSITPGATGYSSLDYNFDRVVASDAKDKWGQIRKRVDDKKEIIAREGVTGFDIARTDEGYRVMPKPDRERSEQARKIHSLVMDRAPKKDPSRP